MNRLVSPLLLVALLSMTAPGWAGESPVAAAPKKPPVKSLKTKVGHTSAAPQTKKAKKAESKPALKTTPKPHASSAPSTTHKLPPGTSSKSP